ncbi:hypothetical protein BACPEC_00212 [[Bacteroides] pectinophilus ATCC 43243]|uniref:Uncharacterized protein n=1 Tax=[Bacteroides] pectinophilus ATCC 43243 TaxID=483218 RepID=B7ANF8_9FIRM|nr:hypothetical protein BACPEC_00212 [[Bacteroides] pectinophilus ATCC 43243]
MLHYVLQKATHLVPYPSHIIFPSLSVNGKVIDIAPTSHIPSI